MKKVLVLTAALMAVVMSAKAEVEFAYEAGAEIVSSYIWSGMYNRWYDNNCWIRQCYTKFEGGRACYISSYIKSK